MFQVQVSFLTSPCTSDLIDTTRCIQMVMMIEVPDNFF